MGSIKLVDAGASCLKAALGVVSGRLYKRFVKNSEDEENDPLYEEGGKCLVANFAPSCP